LCSNSVYSEALLIWIVWDWKFELWCTRIQISQTSLQYHCSLWFHVRLPWTL